MCTMQFHACKIVGTPFVCACGTNGDERAEGCREIEDGVLELRVFRRAYVWACVRVRSDYAGLRWSASKLSM